MINPKLPCEVYSADDDRQGVLLQDVVAAPSGGWYARRGYDLYCFDQFGVRVSDSQQLDQRIRNVGQAVLDPYRPIEGVELLQEEEFVNHVASGVYVRVDGRLALYLDPYGVNTTENKMNEAARGLSLVPRRVHNPNHTASRLTTIRDQVRDWFQHGVPIKTAGDNCLSPETWPRGAWILFNGEVELTPIGIDERGLILPAFGPSNPRPHRIEWKTLVYVEMTLDGKNWYPCTTKGREEMLANR
jgi:hypothetical protein